MQSNLSPAQLQAAVNALAAHGSQVAAAAALGLSRGGIQARLRVAKQRGVTPNNGAADPDDTNALRDRVKRMEAELRRYAAQDDQAQVIKGVIGTLGMKLESASPPAWTVAPLHRPSAPGVPTLFLSDLHWGEVVRPGQINGVNEYNVAIAHRRMQSLVDSAVSLLAIISPKLEYPGIVVPLGGDMISGNIHDELTATNELNSMPAVLDLYETLIGVITALADKFGKVFLPCVTGNHGRDTRKIWSKDRHATSFDWLLYQFLAKRFVGDKRVTFHIPDGSDASYKIYEHRYLLTHGDQFRGGDGMIGALGPIIRGDHKKRSRNAQIDMEYDTMCVGHWHQYIHLTRLIVNGSLKGYDEYAYSGNFPFEPPQQAAWLTHPKYGITYRMPVYVEAQRTSNKTAWASVPQ